VDIDAARNGEAIMEQSGINPLLAILQTVARQQPQPTKNRPCLSQFKQGCFCYGVFQVGTLS